MSTSKQTRTYTCWQCHRRGFPADTLISHRCLDCRSYNSMVIRDNVTLGSSPWTEPGQTVWKKDGSLGPDGGVEFKERKKRIGRKPAARRLKQLKKLKTWNVNANSTD